MKTTAEIPDDLLRQAKKVAAAEHTTLRQLLIQGLQMVLARRARAGRYRLPDKSFGGKGVHPDVTEGSWQMVFDLTYDGRGA